MIGLETPTETTLRSNFMSRRILRPLTCLLVALSLLAVSLPEASAQVTAEQVTQAIERGKKFLVSKQRTDGSNRDGSWTSIEREHFPVGVTSLALLALINSGMTVEDEPIARGLKYLRSAEEPTMTYEISLMIMALTAAKDGQRDKVRLISLVKKLEDSQIKVGENAGSWSYGARAGDGDRSNAQFAILGLREAQYAGIPVERRTWELARDHWKSQQSADGGWNYSGRNNARSTGSMTAAGISTMVIIDSMLRPTDDLNPDGTPNCCGAPTENEALERALAWMEQRFAVGHNPGGGHWLLYYLYGMERAGRLSGRRFFGEHDWYREGAEFLLRGQSRLGSWKGDGPVEQDPVVGTSFALLFLSKGFAPVLINKLKYGDGEDVWNRHPYDVRNLTEMISGLEGWPKLLTSQQVDLRLAVANGGVEDLLQAPVLFFNGRDAPRFSPEEVALLREYVAQGGFILAEAACDKTGFDRGFRQLIEEMYPQGDYKLKRLPPDHPVFHSEYPIDPETVELWGVDVGCRTSIMYSPHDLACLWDKWSIVDPPGRTPQMQAMITKANRVGVNIIAYATGREPPKKINDQSHLLTQAGAQDQIERGFLEIAKLRHTGGWDAAPRALRNLLLALNTYAGATAATRPKDIPVSDPALFRYPLVYMHGRNRFQMTRPEQERLREYLANGGVLFADACCGSPQFDRSFHELIEQMFPGEKLQRIPPTHEMFTTAVGHNLSRVKRREPVANNPDMPLRTHVIEGEPYLEGIERDGRYLVIYSKFDISCALERQASVACTGYVHDDAVKLAVNVVLYSLLQ